jgi:hypothetical protein
MEYECCLKIKKASRFEMPFNYFIEKYYLAGAVATFLVNLLFRLAALFL